MCTHGPRIYRATGTRSPRRSRRSSAAVQSTRLSISRPSLPNYIAFRETLFENRGGFKYLPVIHSLIHLRPDGDSTTGGGTLTVSGYLNIYVIFILVYLIARIRTEPSFLFVAALLLIIFGLSFATQAALNRRIAGALSGE